MKHKIRTEYLRKVRNLEKLELPARNIFMGKNQWALGLLRYSAPIVDSTKELFHRKTRKILTCNVLFFPMLMLLDCK